jgi:Tfp pilus assembly protein PilO
MLSLTNMIFLRKILTFIKTYWKYFLAGVSVLVGFIFLGKKNLDPSVIQKINDAHEDELKKIKELHEKERLENAANLKRMQDTLDEVQKQYDIENKKLDDKKRQEIQDLIKKHGNNPDELAKALSGATGFQIFIP